MTAYAAVLRRYMLNTCRVAQSRASASTPHRNGARNPKHVSQSAAFGSFARRRDAEPVSSFDSAPDADGVPLVVWRGRRSCRSGAKPGCRRQAVRQITLMLQDRTRRSFAARNDGRSGLDQSRLGGWRPRPSGLHDGYTILTALALEAMGLSERGSGWAWAQADGEQISLAGELPLCTFGGLKSRGNPSGATGVYQAVEAALQLRGEAGDNQVDGAETALGRPLAAWDHRVTHVFSAIRIVIGSAMASPSR